MRWSARLRALKRDHTGCPAPGWRWCWVSIGRRAPEPSTVDGAASARTAVEAPSPRSSYESQAAAYAPRSVAIRDKSTGIPVYPAPSGVSRARSAPIRRPVAANPAPARQCYVCRYFRREAGGACPLQLAAATRPGFLCKLKRGEEGVSVVVRHRHARSANPPRFLRGRECVRRSRRRPSCSGRPRGPCRLAEIFRQQLLPEVTRKPHPKPTGQRHQSPVETGLVVEAVSAQLLLLTA